MPSLIEARAGRRNRKHEGRLLQLRCNTVDVHLRIETLEGWKGRAASSFPFPQPRSSSRDHSQSHKLLLATRSQDQVEGQTLLFLSQITRIRQRSRQQMREDERKSACVESAEQETVWAAERHEDRYFFIFCTCLHPRKSKALFPSFLELSC